MNAFALIGAPTTRTTSWRAYSPTTAIASAQGPHPWHRRAAVAQFPIRTVGGMRARDPFTNLSSASNSLQL